VIRPAAGRHGAGARRTVAQTSFMGLIFFSFGGRDPLFVGGGGLK
jgi:hypothetical protein